MKKTVCIAGVLLLVLLFTACGMQESENSQNTENSFRSAIRLVKLTDGYYYDSGACSALSPRCGTLDGDLTQSAELYSVPRENGTANFELPSGYGAGYQMSTEENAIEIPMDDGWRIFKKLETSRDIGQYKYALCLSGTMPSAKTESTLLAFTDNADLTFSEAMEILLGSDSGKSLSAYILPINE